MSTHAVTPDAPAASDRELASNLMPTDKKYRMTGEMPEKLESGATQRKDEETYVPAGVKEELEKESATSGDKDDVKTAPASEATQQQEKPQQKTAQTSESRWQKITRENRELRDRIARIEGAQSAQPQRETQQASQPAAEDSEPTALDKDPKTGEYLYKSTQQLLAAQKKYWETSAEKRALTVWEKKSQEQAMQQAEERIQQEINKRAEQARKDHPDYDEVISELTARKTPDGKSDLFYFPKGSAVDMFFAESPRSQDIFYEIGKDPDKYAEIFAHDAQGKFLMHPVRQLRLLAQIENKLDSQKTEAAPPAKPVTAAPRPPHQVSGKGTVSKDAVAQAVEDGDSASYIAEMNARALARRKKG